MLYRSLLPFLLLNAACVSTHRVSRVTEPGPNGPKVVALGHPDRSVYYALPRAVVKAEVTFTRTVVTSGDCASVAHDSADILEKLNVDAAKLAYTSKRSLKPTAISLSSASEPDPGQIFAIYLNNPVLADRSFKQEWSELGLPSSVSSAATDKSVTAVTNTVGAVASIVGKVIGLGAAEVPLDANGKSGTGVDRLTRRCNDLADELLRIRGARSTLLRKGGPDGGAPKDSILAAVEGMDKEEAALMSHFTGTKETESLVAVCEYLPDTRLYPGGRENSGAVPTAPQELLAYSSLGVTSPNPSGNVALSAGGVRCRIPADLEPSAGLGERLSLSLADGLAAQREEKSSELAKLGEVTSARLGEALIKGVVPLYVKGWKDTTQPPTVDEAAQAAAISKAMATGAAAAKDLNEYFPTDPKALSTAIEKLVRDVVGASPAPWAPATNATKVKLGVAAPDAVLASTVAKVWTTEDREPADTSFFYRIPATASFYVTVDDEEKARARLLVPQYGAVAALPRTRGSAAATADVVFFPDSGALKTLTSTETATDLASSATVATGAGSVFDALIAKAAQEKADADAAAAAEAAAAAASGEEIEE